MDKSQEIEEAMLLQVESTLLQRTPAIVAAMIGAEPAVVELSNIITVIQEKSESQSIDRSGNAVQKAAFREIMVDKTLESTNRGKSYGMDQNLPLLISELDHAKSNLMVMSYPECGRVCKSMYNLITPLLPALLAYGVTAPMLVEVDDSITAFNACSLLPRQGINEKKAATKDIAIAIARAQTTLPRIDASAGMLENTFPEFFTKYFNSRQLINIGGTNLALRVSVTTADGVGLGKVKLHLEGQKLNKKTTEKGNLRIKHLKPAVYSAIFTKNGFRDVKMEIAINDGERTDVTVVMEPLTVLTD